MHNGRASGKKLFFSCFYCIGLLQVVQSDAARSGVPAGPGLLLHLHLQQAGVAAQGGRQLPVPQHEGEVKQKQVSSFVNACLQVIFKVAANSGTAGRGAAVNVPRISPSSPPPSLHSDADQYKDILRPISDVRPFQTGLTQITKDRYDRDQAGVIKQEASTMSAAPGIFSPGLVLTILASLLLRQVF